MFGFGCHRVYKFQQSSGSGLSSFMSKVRVLGFIGFGIRFYKKMLTLNVDSYFHNLQYLTKIERFWTKFGNYFSHLESIGYPRV